MLNQAELNFYGHNKNHIIRRGNRGRVSCVCTYDTERKQYTITRKTPRTTWTERTADEHKAKNIFYNLLYGTMAELENRVRLGTLASFT